MRSLSGEKRDVAGGKLIRAGDRFQRDRLASRFRERRAFIGRVRLAIYQRDSAGIAVFTEFEGCANAGFAGADDQTIHDLLSRSRHFEIEIPAFDLHLVGL